ncbi:MAG: hypothetical protein GY799_10070 [Desulfobulbaceae bacterium]|nr:hypothetical protein [Desulfobulbaceae bacterium]
MRGQHIRVTLLASHLSQRGRTYLGFVGGLVGLAFLNWLIWESVEWMSFAIRLNLKTESSGTFSYTTNAGYTARTGAPASTELATPAELIMVALASCIGLSPKSCMRKKQKKDLSLQNNMLHP